MDTPICDFVSRYAAMEPLRMHMPGHKGTSLLGMESMDITEIDGADSLYEADGIIARSEVNASRIFGCRTFYSTEGSSLCIRAMLYLCVLYAREQDRRPLVAAARNVHSSFVRAAAMLDFDIHWIYDKTPSGYLSCAVNAEALEDWLTKISQKPVALYLTSPDYLGMVSDIQKISTICHKHGVLLIVDNAHGAYLRFLPHSCHPMDLGADLCCDSAHKTLPVLTGGAYLHISEDAPELFSRLAKQAMVMFASTSPSYLILQSLDAVNRYLQQEYPHKLLPFLSAVSEAKATLAKHGYQFLGNEPLKWTLDCKKFGYTGVELAKELKDKNVFPEFYDPDYLVLMLTPEIGSQGLNTLKDVLLSIPKRTPLPNSKPVIRPGVQVLTPRQAAFSLHEIIPTATSKGRILASPSVGCPPAVPILVSGEQIDDDALACFSYYGIRSCWVTIP